MNEEYQITIDSPLLRPGMKIETWVSRKYLVPVLISLLDQVRTFNQYLQDEPQEN